MTTRVAPGATDEALAVAARDDARSFELLYRRYADRIYAYALSRTGLPELADDLVGDTMLAAFEHLHRFDPQRGTFATWLFTIASRRIADQRRAHRRFWRYVATRWRQDPVPVSTLEWAVRADEDARVRAAVARLADSHREVVTLRYVADLTVPEIAATLGISEGAVKMRLNRALSNLADDLEDGPRAD